MTKNKIAIAALCALMCMGTASCNGGSSSSDSQDKTESSQAQYDSSAAEETQSDYVAVSVEGMTPIYSGWITIPTNRNYVIIRNKPNDSHMNGFTFQDFPVDVYEEEDDWLLIESHDTVGYISNIYFTDVEPEVIGHVGADQNE